MDLGNPGDRVTIEVIARLFSDPSQDIAAVLRTVLNEIYEPANEEVPDRLTEILRLVPGRPAALICSSPVLETSSMYLRSNEKQGRQEHGQ